MSSFNKNLIPRRVHKERSQPQHRVSKHGLLEKKQDYKLRARDRNRKQLRLKLLKEKASFRNPDEFYFGMIHSATDAGRTRRTPNLKEKDAVPIAHRDREQRFLAETQDKGYVVFKHSMEEGKIGKMRQRLHFAESNAEGKRRHVVFVDDEEEGKKVLKERQMIGEGEDRTNHPGMHNEKAIRKMRRRAYAELEQRTGRRDKLKTVLQDLDTEKALLAKGRRFVERRADPVTGAPAVYRWQQERKR